MKQPQVTNVEIAEQVYREIYDVLWHDGRRWWYRFNGRWISGHEASRLLHRRISEVKFPDGPYWERGTRVLYTPAGRYRALQMLYRWLQEPDDIPEHAKRPGYR
ncbi:MAG TPA: hypothetical protein VK899_08745 [Gemmatimonadales bacterium]|nr:hypothetical protein [Gemmatimonadales bacterium]